MAAPFQHVLVGTEFLAASHHALDRRVELARNWSARATLRHVVAAAPRDDLIGPAAPPRVPAPEPAACGADP
jgi:nucleotide-binding universal stress UspA family protein